MFRTPASQPIPVEPSGDTHSPGPVDSSAGMAPLENTGVAAHPADEAHGALRIGAALRAAYHENVDGQSPNEQGHGVVLHALLLLPAPLATATEEQSLREDLLANDSLGG